jgi:hypothetical protein
MTFLLLLCALQAESVADQAKRLAKDPKANRDAILKLGPSAIRPLLEVRSDELNPILDELRFGEGHPKIDAMRISIKVCDIQSAGAAKLTFQPQGVRLVFDTAVSERMKERVTLDMQNASAFDVLRAIAKATGTEYGWVRQRLVFSTAERLWPGEPVRRAPLTDAQSKALREAYANLGDDAPDVRDAAARTVIDLGPAAIALLEKLAVDGTAEQKLQGRALIDKLSRLAAEACYPQKLALEGQSGAGAASAIKALSAVAVFDVKKLPLGQALKELVETASLEVELTSGFDDLVTQWSTDESILDLLYFLVAPIGLDAWFADGKLRVDTRERAAAAVKALEKK